MKKVEELKDSEIEVGELESIEKEEEKDLKLSELECLRIENLQLKQDKVRMTARELDFVERQISDDISNRLNIDVSKYTIDLSKRLLIKK